MQQIKISILLLFLQFFAGVAGLSQNVLLDDSKSFADKDIKPNDVIHWQPIQAMVYPDGFVIVSVRLLTEREFTLYKDKVSFSSPAGLIAVKTITPPTREQFDPISQKQVQVFYGGEFEIAFQGSNTFAEPTFPLHINYIGCTNVICLFPYTEKLSLPLYTTNDALPLNFSDLMAPKKVEYLDPQAKFSPPASRPLSPSLSWEDQLAKKLNATTSLWIILLLAFLGGILTNLTPCVYPMIPITIRILAKQTSRPVLGAALYATGIFITYTSLGIFAALTGSLFGSFTANPMFNMVFALLMAGLGISMLGFGSFHKLQQLGDKIGGHQKGLKSAFFMGMAAGLVAAPCTGPILAALLAYLATHSNLFASAVMMSFYSLGFALPYVVLGASAASVSKIRISSRLQTTIKFLFASVMFGLCFYYLRIPFYNFFKDFGPYWLWLTMIFSTLGIVVLCVALFSQNLANRPAFLLPAAIIVGMGIFSTSQYAITNATKIARTSLEWYKEPEEVLAISQSRLQPILIDMWAEWCEACKKMEATTFADPVVIDYLKQKNWLLAKFDLTTSNEKTDKIQKDYNIQSLPTLIIIPDPTKPQEFEHVNGYVGPQTLLEVLKKHTGE